MPAPVPICGNRPLPLSAIMSIDVVLNGKENIISKIPKTNSKQRNSFCWSLLFFFIKEYLFGPCATKKRSIVYHHNVAIVKLTVQPQSYWTLIEKKCSNTQLLKNIPFINSLRNVQLITLVRLLLFWCNDIFSKRGK